MIYTIIDRSKQKTVIKYVYTEQFKYGPLGFEIIAVK